MGSPPSFYILCLAASHKRHPGSRDDKLAYVGTGWQPGHEHNGFGRLGNRECGFHQQGAVGLNRTAADAQVRHDGGGRIANVDLAATNAISSPIQFNRLGQAGDGVLADRIGSGSGRLGAAVLS